MRTAHTNRRHFCPRGSAAQDVSALMRQTLQSHPAPRTLSTHAAMKTPTAQRPCSMQSLLHSILVSASSQSVHAHCFARSTDSLLHLQLPDTAVPSISGLSDGRAKRHRRPRHIGRWWRRRQYIIAADMVSVGLWQARGVPQPRSREKVRRCGRKQRQWHGPRQRWRCGR